MPAAKLYNNFSKNVSPPLSGYLKLVLPPEELALPLEGTANINKNPDPLIIPSTFFLDKTGKGVLFGRSVRMVGVAKKTLHQ